MIVKTEMICFLTTSFYITRLYPVAQLDNSHLPTIPMLSAVQHYIQVSDESALAPIYFQHLVAPGINQPQLAASGIAQPQLAVLWSFLRPRKEGRAACCQLLVPWRMIDVYYIQLLIE